MSAHLALLAVAIAMLLGCDASGVYTATLPEGASSTCDESWKGPWQLGTEATVGMWVGPDCSFTLLSVNDGKIVEAPAAHPRYVESVAFIASREFQAMMDFRHTAPPADAWFILGIAREGDDLLLRFPDRRHVATLIVQGAVPGTLTWASSGEQVAVLTGPGASIGGLVGDAEFFDVDGVLLRVGKDRRALEKALLKAERAAERARRSSAEPGP